MSERASTAGRRRLFPVHIEELVPADHPVRFVAVLVDSFGEEEWARLGFPAPGRLGAPGVPRRVLCGAWLGGFLSGIRSTRGLERACREQAPLLWLTDMARPDHNTLWRFYDRLRPQMRELLRLTVEAAARSGLADLAVAAVDGTKVAAGASRGGFLPERELAALLARVDAAADALEAGLGGREDPRLPAALAEQEALRARVLAALAASRSGGRKPRQASPQDPEARLLRGRHGILAGYNAQAAACALDPAAAGRTGLLLLAADVSSAEEDSALLPMMAAQARENAGSAPGAVVADTGYHSGPSLAACAALGQPVAVPERRLPAGGPARMPYDPASDTLRCPAGHGLRRIGEIRRKGRPPVRRYGLDAALCRACPLFGTCTRNARHGRTVEMTADDAALRAHRAWMETAPAQALVRLRGQLVEPAFGIIKDRMGGRRMLCRGLAKVRAEWQLLAAAFNVKTLARVWAGRLAAAA